MLAIKSPQAWLHQPGVRREAGKYIAQFNQPVLIIAGATAWASVNPEFEASLRDAGVKYNVEIMQGQCTDEQVARFAQRARQSGASVVVGVGGGRVLDTAKATGDSLDNGIVVTFPTIAATCAAWSPLVVYYNDEGAQLRSIPLKTTPHLVLVDSEVIARSNVRYLKAGIVDALAKWYEFRPWSQHSPDNLALRFKAHTARLVVDIVAQHGAQALQDNQDGRVTPALMAAIDAAISVAGMANSIRDALPTPGVAHAIHNRLTLEPGVHDWLHGEKVGFGLLVQSLLENDGDTPEPELLALLRQYGAPLILPVPQARRRDTLRAIADGVRFPAQAAASLPFSLTPDRIHSALTRTFTLAGV